MPKLNAINHWARLSCDRWNKNQLSRRVYRKLYQRAAKKCWESPAWRKKTEQYQDGYYYFDTYPWPYNHPCFANWGESSTPGDSTLVLDQAGFVIKTGASYCAWKIYESTGRWLRNDVMHLPYHGELVSLYLLQNGYHVVTALEPRRGCRYIGVGNHDSEAKDEAVWFEKPCDRQDGREGVIASTYRGQKYFCGSVNPKDYTWIQIK